MHAVFLYRKRMNRNTVSEFTISQILVSRVPECVVTYKDSIKSILTARPKL